MFEAEDVPEVKKASGEPKLAPFKWSAYPVQQLIAWRDEITRHLPPTNLKDMNLEEELLLQFHAVRDLQGTVLEDEEIPLNQRAQLANNVASTLSKLIEMQEKVYTQERFKLMEGILIRCLNRLPEESAAQFLDEYERALKANG